MKKFSDYMSKMEKMAVPMAQPKFIDVSETKNRDDLTSMESLEDYREIKELVKNLDEGIGLEGKSLAPIPVPVKSNESK